MAREPSEETERAEERQPGPDAPEETRHDPGRTPPPDEAEQRRLAREQGRLIASGQARKGYIALRTPLRLAIFIAGLVGAVVLALILLVAR